MTTDHFPLFALGWPNLARYKLPLLPPQKIGAASGVRLELACNRASEGSNARIPFGRAEKQALYLVLTDGCLEIAMSTPTQSVECPFCNKALPPGYADCRHCQGPEQSIECMPARVQPQH